MQDVRDPVYRRAHVVGIPEVSNDEFHVIGDAVQIFRIPGREIVQYADFLASLDQFCGNVRPDKPATSGDQGEEV